jgi:rhamnulose-1-phosphate aldolase
MDQMLNAPFLRKLVRTTAEMYRQGWDERNGGNISMRLTAQELAPYVDPNQVLRELPMGFASPKLAGAYFLVTATGSYFRNVQYDVAASLGLIRIGADGKTAQVVWGFEGGGRFTSELPSHLMTHQVRLELGHSQRVVMHCHPTSLLAMTYVHDLEERAFTRTLWRMCTECIMVFPDGVNVLPWMPCGTDTIGRATAEKMKTARLVLWAQHGIYAAGASLDETYGLIETAEKAAEVYLKIAHLPWKNNLTDRQLCDSAAAFGVTPRDGYLDLTEE